MSLMPLPVETFSPYSLQLEQLGRKNNNSMRPLASHPSAPWRAAQRLQFSSLLPKELGTNFPGATKPFSGTCQQVFFMSVLQGFFPSCPRVSFFEVEIVPFFPFNDFYNLFHLTFSDWPHHQWPSWPPCHTLHYCPVRSQLTQFHSCQLGI